MTRAFASGEYNESVANTGDPESRKMGEKLVAGLFQQLGPAKAIAVLAVAITDAFLAILHTESPLPEQNIKALHTLIDAMKENVRRHETCALKLTRALVGDDGKPGPEKVH